MDRRAFLGITFAGLSGFLAVSGAACGGATPATPAEGAAEARPGGAPPAATMPPAPTGPASDPGGTAGATPTPAANAQTPAVPAPPAAAPALAIPPNTAVLHIGDSFTLAGFAQALKPRIKALGARYDVKSEQSSYTVTWAPKMEILVANTQPDLVIISLGANEVANTNPPAHAHAVRRIVKSIGARPCVWVSPPLWRKDTGIIDVIRENSAPCRFFDSDALVSGPIPRQSDKIHPNDEGGAMWAEAFWRWLESERARDDEPDAAGNKGPGRSPWALRPAPAEEHQARRAP